MKKLLDRTFLKFIVVGIINTMVGTTVMFVFYNFFHIGYWASSIANYIIGSICSFILNKYFTFNNSSNDPKMVVKFVLNVAICYIVAYGMAKPILRLAMSNAPKTIQENGALFLGMVLFVLLNYLGQRFWVFKKEE